MLKYKAIVVLYVKVYIVRSCRPTKVDCAIQNPKKDVLTVTGMPIHLIFSTKSLAN